MVNILEIKNPLGNGCTEPYIVRCDDNNIYVVKFPGNIQGKKVLVNEYVASSLCKYLDLPIMDFNLINVKSEDFNNNIPNNIRNVVGTAFGTRYNDRALTIINSGQISKAINNYDAIKILIFDLLIGNNDRNPGNLMIDTKTKKLIMIDHSHIFEIGTLWDKYQLPRLINEEFDIKKLHIYGYINIIESLKYDDLFYTELNNFVNKVKNIKKDFIKNIIYKIPNDWSISKEEKELLIEFIEKRFSKIDSILKLLNIKGGDNND